MRVMYDTELPPFMSIVWALQSSNDVGHGYGKEKGLLRRIRGNGTLRLEVRHVKKGKGPMKPSAGATKIKSK